MTALPLTPAQREIIAPLVAQFCHARDTLTNSIILAAGEQGWTLNFETMELTKPTATGVDANAVVRGQGALERSPASLLEPEDVTGATGGSVAAKKVMDLA